MKPSTEARAKPLIRLGAALCLPLASLILCPTAVTAAAGENDERQVIEKQDDLPRHSYTLTLPVTAYYEPANRDALLALARVLRKDVEEDLAAYDIRDDNTVQEFYGLLGSVALLEEDWASYLEYLEKRRDLETKEASRLTMGLVGEALARARLAGSTSPESVAEALQELVAPLPYETVEANLEGLKGQTEILSRALVLGSLESSYQPVVEGNEGVVSFDVASSLVSASFTLDHFIPLAEAVNGVVGYAIETNRVEKPDIWADRQVALGDDEGSPVLLAVWDSGVDTAIFETAGQLWTNEAEIPHNGIDDDDNGYVDDVHGIAYDLHANRVTEMLYPIGEVARDELALQQLVKGIGDIQFNVDTPATGGGQGFSRVPVGLRQPLARHPRRGHRHRGQPAGASARGADDLRSRNHSGDANACRRSPRGGHVPGSRRVLSPAGRARGQHELGRFPARYRAGAGSQRGRWLAGRAQGPGARDLRGQ